MPYLRRLFISIPHKLFSLAAVLAVLLPTFGPWVNEDFAALQPVHDHVYLGEPDPHHHEHGSQKHKKPEARLHGPHPAGPCPDDARLSAVINLYDQNAGHWSQILPPCADSAAILAAAEGGLVTGWMESYLLRHGRVIPPADEPPRS